MLRSFSPQFQNILLRSYRFILSVPFFRSLLQVFHPETGTIVSFLQYTKTQLKPNERILDAGAGSQNYRPFFTQQKYEATDFCEVPKVYQQVSSLDFICDLKKIPRPNNSYDAILNIQVLEHVPDPLAILKEFHRILKKGGQLFLTAPQGWGLHDEPHHYFNFTRYGLKELFTRAGFQIKFIHERGGYFRYLTMRLQEMPLLFFRNIFHPLKFLFAIPLFLITFPLFYLITPPILFILDLFFDREQKYTLGYACHCIKK
ncbi:methyltransferase domain-containing protein [Candidatus Woesearchaeota archaeon]|nr:methyltransferase domain-containing protein [Candidatus Woesearchaeota archaeon]